MNTTTIEQLTRQIAEILCVIFTNKSAGKVRHLLAQWLLDGIVEVGRDDIPNWRVADSIEARSEFLDRVEADPAAFRRELCELLRLDPGLSPPADLTSMRPLLAYTWLGHWISELIRRDDCPVYVYNLAVQLFCNFQNEASGRTYEVAFASYVLPVLFESLAAERLAAA